MSVQRLRIFDAFFGTGGWSAAYKARGHDIVSLDIQPKFKATLTADVLKVTPEMIEAAGEHPGRIDAMLISPPCEHYSVAAISRNWIKGPGETLIARRPEAEYANKLVLKSLELVEALKPRFWWMENPRAALRKMPFMQRYRRTTITYCRYGDTRMKPTDLWGVWPEGWTGRGACNNGDPCHVSAPRGSKTPGSTQGMADAEERGHVPWQLSEETCLAVERAFGIEPPTPMPVTVAPIPAGGQLRLG